MNHRRSIATFLLHSFGGIASSGAGLATWTLASTIAKRFFNHRLRLWEALAFYGIGCLSMFAWIFVRKRECIFRNQAGRTWTQQTRLIYLNPQLLQDLRLEEIQIPFWSGRLNFVISSTVEQN